MTIGVLACPDCEMNRVPHEKSTPFSSQKCPVCKTQFSPKPAGSSPLKRMICQGTDGKRLQSVEPRGRVGNQAASPGPSGGEPVWSLLIILAIGLAGDFLLRWGLPGWPAPFYLGIALVLIGMVLIAWAASEFSNHKTTLIPTEAASVIVKSGPYRYTRNPIYLSMALVYSGITLMFDSPLALILLLPVIVVLNRQAVREERYLEGAFGDQYTEYKRRVRRWL